MCSEDPGEPLQDRSVTTSRVLHLLVTASLDWLQLLVTLFLQPAETQTTSNISIQQIQDGCTVYLIFFPESTLCCLSDL